MSTTPSPGGCCPDRHRAMSQDSDPKETRTNRLNAKSSTGPRTDRGKKNSRFNALTLGLFAKHVVIPICDRYKPEKDFKSLLDGLHQEFQPTVGVLG